MNTVHNGVESRVKELVQMLTIEDDLCGQRIDNYLITMLKGVPKTHIYQIIRKGRVRVNGKRIKHTYRLVDGDKVRIPPVRVSPVKKHCLSEKTVNFINSRVVFENDVLLIFNKPSGLAVHGGSGISMGLIEQMRYARPKNSYYELVHRLDRDTSGCIMIAKKRSMLRLLHEQIRLGAIGKKYQLLVLGSFKKEKVTVNLPLLKSVIQSGERMVTINERGKSSVTHFKRIKKFKNFTLLEADIETGRTHQIRVHAASLGFPILGDDKYGNKAVNKEMRGVGFNRLFLHASTITLNMLEFNGIEEFKAPLPKELMLNLYRLEKQTESII